MTLSGTAIQVVVEQSLTPGSGRTGLLVRRLFLPGDNQEVLVSVRMQIVCICTGLSQSPYIFSNLYTRSLFSQVCTCPGNHCEEETAPTWPHHVSFCKFHFFRARGLMPQKTQVIRCCDRGMAHKWMWRVNERWFVLENSCAVRATKAVG